MHLRRRWDQLCRGASSSSAASADRSSDGLCPPPSLGSIGSSPSLGSIGSSFAIGSQGPLPNRGGSAEEDGFQVNFRVNVFPVDCGRGVSDKVQCNQAGVTKCRG